MQVGVGMKLSCHKVLYFSRCRGIDICETVDKGVGRIAIELGGGNNDALLRRLYGLRLLRYLSDDKGKGEGELVVVSQLKDEGWSA